MLRSTLAIFYKYIWQKWPFFFIPKFSEHIQTALFWLILREHS